MTLVPEIDMILNYHSHPSVAEFRKLEDMREALDWNDINLFNTFCKSSVINNEFDMEEYPDMTLSGPFPNVEDSTDVV